MKSILFIPAMHVDQQEWMEFLNVTSGSIKTCPAPAAIVKSTFIYKEFRNRIIYQMLLKL